MTAFGHERDLGSPIIASAESDVGHETDESVAGEAGMTCPHVTDRAIVALVS